MVFQTFCLEHCQFRLFARKDRFSNKDRTTPGLSNIQVYKHSLTHTHTVYSIYTYMDPEDCAEHDGKIGWVPQQWHRKGPSSYCAT